ncbi:MAG: M67 family metallopeptidase [Chitinophagales bacterium]|nr:M67 family metallopeptidase [Chitinophagales bacterium]
MSDLKLKIHSKTLKEMESHAKLIFPYECCGFFFGNEANGRLITRVLPVQNVKNGDQRRRFEIDPVDYMKAEQHALENNVKLLGIFHSHPLHKAIPSQHDLKQALPYFSYIILSVYSNSIEDITSWRLNDEGAFENEIIYLTDKKSSYGKNHYSNTA